MSKKRDPNKPRKETAQERWLRRIAAGFLMRTSAPTEGGWRYTVEPGGLVVPSGTAISLIRNKLIEPVNDGLFNDPPITQTYRVPNA